MLSALDQYLTYRTTAGYSARVRVRLVSTRKVCGGSAKSSVPTGLPPACERRGVTPRLDGRVVVVTGAARGIGRAVAKGLATEGASLVLADLESSADTLAAAHELGARALAVRVDLTDETDVASLRDAALHEFGAVDVLVNNAGRGRVEAFEDMTLDSWRQILAINLDAMFLTCRAFIPGMREREWGRVVNVASNTFGIVTTWGCAHYVASKGGVIGLTRALASEFGPYGVTVNAVSPGLTRTPATAERMRDLFAYYRDAQPIKRTGVPEDLAGTVAFLASNDAAFLTGQNVVVDGGLLRN